MGARKALLLLGICAAGLCVAGTVAWRVRASGRTEARTLDGAGLLDNLRGYLRVGRIEEAAQALNTLEAAGDRDSIDQARYEVARAHVAAGRGELAVALLDRITLHDRTFDFQRAVLREKLRGLYGFFFDPAGELRTPAQLDDYVLNSRLNPDEKLRPRNPAGFEDANKLIDYFGKVVKQLEDVLEIRGLPRSEEPELAADYDAIQVLLYGRGDIGYEKLAANLAGSSTAESARTLYLLGGQHFAEADYDRAFATWAKLAAHHASSAEALRAFEKTWELFEGRRLLAGAFAFWPLERPAWLDRLAAREPFKSKATETTARLEAHKDIAGYGHGPVKVVQEHDPPKCRMLFKANDVTDSPSVEDPADAISDIPLIEPLLTRDRSLGWRLQTEFREFNIRRLDSRVLAPSEKKLLELRTSYYGEVRFSLRRFPDGQAYAEFRTLPPDAAVAAAAALPEVKSWTQDLGPMSANGRHSSATVEVPVSGQGFYLVTARARYVPVVAAAQLAVVADKVLTWSSPTGVLYRAVNRETGAPVPNARLRGIIEPHYVPARVAPQFHDGTKKQEFVRGFDQGFLTGKRDELVNDQDDFLAGFAEGLKLRAGHDFGPQRFEVRTDADGLARVAVPEKWRLEDCLVKAELGELGGVCPIESWCRQPGGATAWRSIFYAERPVFMPGEKARMKGILRRLGPGGLSLPERRETEFMLWRDNGLIAVMRATPNENGTVALEAALPESAPVGAYHLTIGPSGESHPVFKVDRFEVPLLDTRVETDAGTVFAGSSARGRVTVRHARLVPAAGVPVAVTVYAGPAPEVARPADQREDFFEPVRLADYPDPSRQDLLKHELRGLQKVWEAAGATAGDGTFPFSFETEHGEARRYVVVARVRALADRWESARTEMLSSRLPLFLTVEPERTNYYPGETLRARVASRGLDGRPGAAALRLFVKSFASDGREITSARDFRTDEKGEAWVTVPLGNRAPTVEVGLHTGDGWARQPVAFNLRQVGSSVGSGGLTVKVDRKAYYPGETARATLELDRPGADVLVTVCREDVLRSMRVVVTGSSGTFDLPVGEAESPNVYLQAVAVWDDVVRKAELAVPVIPAHKFLKVEVLTDRDDHVAGEAVSAVVRVTDSRGKPVGNAEVSLAAVRSSAFAVQEDLTPDLARYFLNFVRPLLVDTGESSIAADSPRSDCYWLHPVFAWGVYEDLVGRVEGGGLAGCFGYRSGGGRRYGGVGCGGCAGASGAAQELYCEFLRQHGLTLFWESRLVTDEKGEARAEFLLPADGGEFRFTARAVNAGTFVGELRKSVRCRRDLIVQAPWPASIREGELVRMPAFVVNGSAAPRKVKLSVQSDLPVKLLEESHAVELAPGGIFRADIEIDARKLPDRLPGEERGWQPAAGFAGFALTCEDEGGRKAESRAMVSVRRTGIPIERLTVVVARRGEGTRSAAFDLTKAVPGSVRLEVAPLAAPEGWIRMLKTRMSDAGVQGGAASARAWAEEAGAPGLSEAERKAGKSLPIDGGLVRTLAAFRSGVSDDDCAAYFLACASASARGVAIPPAWPESAFRDSCGRLGEIRAPASLWGLAVFAAASPERLADAEKIAARLESLRTAGVESAADWAYLAMAFAAMGRPTKAAWCLDKGLFTAGLGGNPGDANYSDAVATSAQAAPAHSRHGLHATSPCPPNFRPGVEDSATLLLAGTRLGLDARTLGGAYAALLEAVAAAPRTGDWPSAVAVHALAEWARIAGPTAGPVKASIGAEICDLTGDRPLVRFPPAGRRLEVAVEEPATGSAGVQIRCSYRVLHSDVEKQEEWSIERRFARVAPDGSAEMLEAGDAIRLGDSLLVIVETRSGETGGRGFAPVPGPWPADGSDGKLPLTRRVRRDFVLDRSRRARTLAAVEAGKIDAARAEIIAAVEAGDFIVETAPAGLAVPGCNVERIISVTGTVPLAAGKTAFLLIRPDRTGTFLAPAAWLTDGNDAEPLAVAPPFPIAVVGTDEELPPRRAELQAADWMRRPVCDALRLAPNAWLAARLGRAPAQIDARALALQGLLRSGSSRAPAVYAQLAWGNPGIALDELASLVKWRREMLSEGGMGDFRTHAPNRSVLSMALSSDRLLDRLAETPELPVRLLGADDPYAAIISMENDCRRALYDAASVSPVADGLTVRTSRPVELLSRLPARKVDLLLDRWDRLPSSGSVATGDGSLREAISAWAGSFGMKADFARDVPDLERGEYVLWLPERGSAVTLDGSLRPMALRARRDGRTVRIWLDRNLAGGPYSAVMASGARSPEERLKVFLANCAGGEDLLTDLLASLASGAAGGASSYMPRTEKSATLKREALKVQLDPLLPLGSQLDRLAAQGIRIEIRSGVLRIARVE